MDIFLYFQPSEPKIKSSRMLLLELTDGTQTVFGMEYQLIPALKVSTPPGTKVVNPFTPEFFCHSASVLTYIHKITSKKFP